MDENNALVKLSKATQMLAEAKTLDEVLGIRDIATAAKTYAKAAKMGLAAQNDAAEIKIKAERKAGEMLAKLPRNEGGYSPHDATPPPSYEELGIERTQAHRWQKMALVPEEQLVVYLNATREEQKEITSKEVYNIARGLERNEGTYLGPNHPVVKKNEALDNIAFAMTKQAIRDAATGKWGDEPGNWLLNENEYRPLLEARIPYSIIVDWVNGGCRTIPLHEHLLELLDKKWGIGEDDN